MKVVVLGDSYSAGNGADNYYGPEGCWRSSRNWAEQYVEALNATRPVRLINRACHGASIRHMNEPRFMDAKEEHVLVPGNVSKEDPRALAELEARGDCEPRYRDDEFYVKTPISAQLAGLSTIVTFSCSRYMAAQWDAVDESTDLILFSAGGNDVFFEDIVRSCFAVFRSVDGCRDTVEDGIRFAPGVGDDTVAFLHDLKAEMRPDARIVVKQYPYLEKDPNFELREPLPPLVTFDSFAVGREIRRLGDVGDTEQRAAVDEVNLLGGAPVRFFDEIKPHFAGHEPDGRACCQNGDRWISEFLEGDFTKLEVEPYHYNPIGHFEDARLLAAHGAFGAGTAPLEGSVDIAFVIDTTGSMSSAIGSVKAAATDLVNTVAARTNSSRFALVDYRDWAERTGSLFDYPAQLRQDFTTSATTINGAIQALSLGDGGDVRETMYSGINAALDLTWRPGAKKVVIVLADAPALSPEPITGLTGEDIIARALSIDPAEVHFVDVGSATTDASAADIATRTNGGIYRSTPSQAAAEIAEAIDVSLDRPAAWAGGPYVGKIGTTLTLDARGSSVVTSPIVKYEWDVNSDGTYEYVGTSPTRTHAYTSAFDGLVTLRVTDGAGRVGLATTVGHASVDGDEKPAGDDNCPDVANHGQDDFDDDGVGDACDATPGYPEPDPNVSDSGDALKADVIAAGNYNSLAVNPGGTVSQWGTTAAASEPVTVSGLTAVTGVAAGERHSLAVKSDGTVWAWGSNARGQLGNGGTTSSSVPVRVSGLTGATAVRGGWFHSIALKTDGTVWAWGDNQYGQLGSSGPGSSLPVRVGGNGLSGVTRIASGPYHGVALKSDGTVWAWGYNFEGQLGDNTTKNAYKPVRVSNLTGVVAVAAGYHHSLALKSDGTAWAWGRNFEGELGNGSTTKSLVPVRVGSLTGVAAIAAGIAVRSDGRVWTWGDNGDGQLGNGSTVDSLVPVSVSGIEGVTAVATGSLHHLVLKSDRTVWGWGGNWFGELGIGRSGLEGGLAQSTVPTWVGG